jgi:hypothetical protein
MGNASVFLSEPALNSIQGFDLRPRNITWLLAEHFFNSCHYYSLVVRDMPLRTSQAHFQTYWSVLEGSAFAYGQFCPPAKGTTELLCSVLGSGGRWRARGLTPMCGSGPGGGWQAEPLLGRDPAPTRAGRGRVLVCHVRRREQPPPRWLAGATMTPVGAAPSPVLPFSRGSHAREIRHHAWPAPVYIRPPASFLPCLQPPRPRAPLAVPAAAR